MADVPDDVHAVTEDNTASRQTPLKDRLASCKLVAQLMFLVVNSLLRTRNA